MNRTGAETAVAGMIKLLDLPLGEIVLVVGQVSFLKIDIHDAIVGEFDLIVVVPVCGGQAIRAILADDLVDYDITPG